MEDRDLPGGGDAYERPSANWQCNHADGSRCWLGPNHLGVCGATPDCIPQKKEDRWICNRSHHRGGPCTHGPTPQGKCSCVQAKCSPQRSLRGKRGVFTLCVVALTLGGLTLFLNTPARQTILMPGPLSSHHANVMSAIESEGCATCHPGANRSTEQTTTKQRPVGPTSDDPRGPARRSTTSDHFWTCPPDLATT